VTNVMTDECRMGGQTNLMIAKLRNHDTY